MFIAVGFGPSLADPLLQYKGRQELGPARRRGRELGIVSQQTGSSSRPTRSADRQGGRDAIEDKRFRTNSGVDVRASHARSSRTSCTRGPCRAPHDRAAVIKNALQAQSHRTIFREAARGRPRLPALSQVVQGKDLTPTQHDLLRQRCLRIESAAQTYFGQDVNHLGCGTPRPPACVEQLQRGRPLCSRACRLAQHI